MPDEHGDAPLLDWSRVNPMLYRSDPAEYFETRSSLLLIYAHDPPILPGAIPEKVSLAPVTLTFNQLEGTPLDEDADESRRLFVIAEAQVLYHHAIETLFRLHLAHRDPSPCPWIELASMRSPGKFKKWVERRFVDSDSIPEDADWQNEIARLYFGQPYDELRDDETIDAVRNIELSLRTFAADLLSQANQYNAAKHGFGISAAEGSSLSIGSPEEAAFFKHTGDAIHTLELDGDPPEWRFTMRWVDPGVVIAYQRVASLLIRAVWSIGRVMHTDETEAFVFTMPKPVRELVPQESGLTSMAISLGALLTARSDPPSDA